MIERGRNQALAASPGGVAIIISATRLYGPPPRRLELGIPDVGEVRGEGADERLAGGPIVMRQHPVLGVADREVVHA
jgi:hypothetical protein